MLRATTACTFLTSQLPKVVRTRCVLHILTCKCASRHNGVHFFDISTAKSGPHPVCFAHFDLQMCFAPQPGHLNCQKCALYILTCKCASRHKSGPQRRAIFHLSKVVRIWPAGSAPAAALVSLLFDPPERQIIGLDDGWPESVEEQGLLLLVWRHHITKQYIKHKTI